MTSVQRIIKYLAIAFAIFLVVSIIGGILGGLALITGLSGSTDLMEEMQSLAFTGEVHELRLDIGALNVEILPGDTLAAETNSKNVTCKVDSGVLTIRESNHNWLRVGQVGKLVLTVPKDFVFDKADLEFGAGTVEIDGLTAGKLDLNLGAGEVIIRSLTVTGTADIEGGAGKLSILGGSLSNLDMDLGVGELVLESKLTGSSEIDFGVGSAKLVLQGSPEDYRIRLDKGLGSATLDGEKMEDKATYGSGPNSIDLDGGVGEIRVDFTQE